MFFVGLFVHISQHFQFEAAGFVSKTFVKVKLVNMGKLNGCHTVKLIGATNSQAM
jgi:hypothetical protein